jgi:hypothetical protein
MKIYYRNTRVAEAKQSLMVEPGRPQVHGFPKGVAFRGCLSACGTFLGVAFNGTDVRRCLPPRQFNGDIIFAPLVHVGVCKMHTWPIEIGSHACPYKTGAAPTCFRDTRSCHAPFTSCPRVICFQIHTERLEVCSFCFSS